MPLLKRSKGDVQTLVESETRCLSVQTSEPFKCSTHVGEDSIPPAPFDGPDAVAIDAAVLASTWW